MALRALISSLALALLGKILSHFPCEQAPPLLFPQSDSSRSNELLGPDRCKPSSRVDSPAIDSRVEGKDLLAEHVDGIGRPVSPDPTRTTHFGARVSGNQLFLVK
jgi:hypothetical protein